ncbi:MAG: hypothetical protein KDE55_17470 [Novosphingobium sp.]|nr:hypothetical protein [Novosphingobium sp.]
MGQTHWQDITALVTRMLRTWCAARAIGEDPLLQMRRCALPPAQLPHFVAACDSLFGMTEAALERRLATARCCSARLSRDEAAVLAILRYAPVAGAVHTSRSVPHGLPDTLRWSALAVLEALDVDPVVTSVDIVETRCPFDAPAERAA